MPDGQPLASGNSLTTNKAQQRPGCRLWPKDSGFRGLCASHMSDFAGERTEFYRRLDRPGVSICLACFRSVIASRSEPLEQAEDAHRRECPNGMKIPDQLASLR